MQIMINKFSLYIPSTVGENHIDQALHESYVRGYANMMLAEFGGVTVTKGIGMWTNEAKITVTENVSIITASTNIDAFEFMQMLAENVKNLLKQECVSLEVNGGLYLI